MRKYFLLTAVILIIPLNLFSQAEVSIDCQDQWGAGRYNKVTVSVTFREDGFARFTQDYPVGFDVAGAVSKGCDLSWTGSQLNVVFMNIKQGKQVEFSYYIKPDNNMNGPFNMNGEVIIISGGIGKSSVKLPEKSINIGGSNGLLPEEMKVKPLQPVAFSQLKIKVPDKVTFSSKAIYRVQISASTKVITEARLRKETGLDKTVKISVIKSGSVYKYQAGEYTEYDSAVKLLKKLKDKGVKGAFIVTYMK